MAGPGGSHPGRVGGERAARDSNMSGGGRNRDRDRRDRSMHPGRVGGEQAARASNQMGGRQGTRPGGDHPGRVGGEQAQAASSVGAPSVDRFKDARNALGSRIRDEADLGNTDLENAANLAADIFGFHELEPEFDLDNLDDDADWGFDVLGAVAGMAGMAAGVPLLGSIVSQGEELLGIRDEASINLGTLNSPDEDEETPLGFAGGDEDTAGTAAVMGGGGVGNANGPLDDELIPDRDLVKPPKPPKVKPPKPYSNVMLGDVVSVLDWLA